MKILAIDTCTEVASVTLFSSEVKITRVLTDIPKSSGHILKLCDKVFKEVREDLKEYRFNFIYKWPWSIYWCSDVYWCCSGVISFL